MNVRLIILIFFLTTTNFLVAQNDTIKHKYLKVFLNGKYAQYENHIAYGYLPQHNSFYSDNVDFSLGFLSISCEKYFKNGNSHEIELLPFSFNYKKDDSYFYDSTLHYFRSRDNSAKVFSFETNLRYQYNLKFNKKSKGNFKPYFGFSSSLFYYFKSTKPLNGYFYNTNVSQIGLGLSVIPSISYKIANNLYLDLNIPFRFFDIVFEKTKIDNPPEPKDHKITKNIELVEFPKKYYLRIGLTMII